MSFHANLDRELAKAELFANHLDWVPVISSFSAAARFTAGQIQCVVSAIFIAVKTAQYWLTKDWRAKRDADLAWDYIPHGILNMARACVAAFPVFNLLCILHDYEIGRYNYLQEKRIPGVYFLNNPRSDLYAW